MRVLERDGRNENLPSLVALAPAKLSALQRFKLAFRSRQTPARTDQHLPKVFRPQAEVKTKANKQVGTGRLRRSARVAPRVRTQFENFVGNLQILGNRACGFEDGQD